MDLFIDPEIDAELERQLAELSGDEGSDGEYSDARSDYSTGFDDGVNTSTFETVPPSSSTREIETITKEYGVAEGVGTLAKNHEIIGSSGENEQDCFDAVLQLREVFDGPDSFTNLCSLVGGNDTTNFRSESVFALAQSEEDNEDIGRNEESQRDDGPPLSSTSTFLEMSKNGLDGPTASPTRADYFSSKGEGHEVDISFEDQVAEKLVREAGRSYAMNGEELREFRELLRKNFADAAEKEDAGEESLSEGVADEVCKNTIEESVSPLSGDGSVDSKVDIIDSTKSSERVVPSPSTDEKTNADESPTPQGEKSIAKVLVVPAAEEEAEKTTKTSKEEEKDIASVENPAKDSTELEKSKPKKRSLFSIPGALFRKVFGEKKKEEEQTNLVLTSNDDDPLDELPSTSDLMPCEKSPTRNANEEERDLPVVKSDALPSTSQLVPKEPSPVKPDRSDEKENFEEVQPQKKPDDAEENCSTTTAEEKKTDDKIASTQLKLDSYKEEELRYKEECWMASCDMEASDFRLHEREMLRQEQNGMRTEDRMAARVREMERDLAKKQEQERYLFTNFE